MSEITKVIKLSNRTSVRKLIDYFASRVGKDKEQPLEMVAMGSAIHKLVNTVELLTHLFPGLYYKFEFATVIRKFINAEGTLIDQKQTPLLKSLFAFAESKVDLTTFIQPLPADLYEKLNKKLVERKETKRKAFEKSLSKQKGNTANDFSFRVREEKRPRMGRPERLLREPRSVVGNSYGPRRNFYWQKESWTQRQSVKAKN